MALVNRIARLFRADFHAVLDQLEEPELVLKQAVRDMEDELAAAEQRIAALARERAALAARTGELEAALADTGQQLDLCFRSGRDELAKKMLRRKLESERLLKHLRTSRDALARQHEEERRLADENGAALTSLRQKAELFARRAPAPAGIGGHADAAWTARQVAVSDEEVEIAYLREQELRSVS
ncbi:MAG TPA: PspA/IM30 family protein [Woeseiaceae bacterium]|nr:PspA/IM30 family protein [Woeseiaceae bacterium]